MPFPIWALIAGGAALVTAIAASSSDDRDDVERRARERRAEQAREEARRAEEARLARERQERLHSYACQQVANLLDRHGLDEGELEDLAELAIDDPQNCRDALMDAFDDSASVREERAHIQTCSQQIRELEKLYAQLGR